MNGTRKKIRQSSGAGVNYTKQIFFQKPRAKQNFYHSLVQIVHFPPASGKMYIIHRPVVKGTSPRCARAQGCLAILYFMCNHTQLIHQTVLLYTSTSKFYTSLVETLHSTTCCGNMYIFHQPGVITPESCAQLKK